MRSTCFDCGRLATCPVCESCEKHCNTGGSGICVRMSWNESKVRDAMNDLISEGGRRTCFICGGLEADDDPHLECRARPSSRTR